MTEKIKNNEEAKRHIELVEETDDAYTIKFTKEPTEEEETEEEETVEEEVDVTVEEEEEETQENNLKSDALFSSEQTTELADDKIVSRDKWLLKRRADYLIECRGVQTPEERSELTMDISVSSESPVQRTFGNEILGHRESDNVRLERLKSRAPLLLNHDARQQIGVVENASLDIDHGRLMAKVRFGNSDLAKEIFQDVQDDIRSNVSISYQIYDMERDEDDATDDVRVTDWEPYEVSIVSVPADFSIGVGRSLGRSASLIENLTKMEKTMEDITTEPTVDNDAHVRTKITEGIKARKKEINEILSLGGSHNRSELARKAVDDDISLAEFRGQLLEEIKNTPLVKADIGMTDKDVKRFSLIRAIKSLAGEKVDADFEFECSRAYSERVGKQPSGIYVPMEVQAKWTQQERALTTTTGASIVFDDLRYQDFIEALRPWSTILKTNPVTLSGLTGNVSIPKTTANAATFITEGSDVSESVPTLSQVTLSEKTAGSYIDVTRSLLNNVDGFSAEQFVRNQISLGIATAFDAGAISGSGSSGNPQGIEGTSGINTVTIATAQTPTWAEVCEAEALIYEENVALDNGAYYITTPTVNSNMKTTPKVSGAGASSFVAQDGFTNGYPILISSQVTSGVSIFGDFSNQFLVGLWGGLDINVDSATLSKSGGLRIVGLQSVDFGVKNATAFTKLVD